MRCLLSLFAIFLKKKRLRIHDAYCAETWVRAHGRTRTSSTASRTLSGTIGESEQTTDATNKHPIQFFIELALNGELDGENQVSSSRSIERRVSDGS